MHPSMKIIYREVSVMPRCMFVRGTEDDTVAVRGSSGRGLANIAPLSPSSSTPFEEEDCAFAS